MLRLDKIIQAEGINVTPASKDALIALSKGDMRRVLNVLQAASSTVDKNAPIEEDLIYAVTATPHPSELQRILDCLMNCSNFQTALGTIKRVQEEHSLALQDIVGALFDRINSLQIPAAFRISLTKQLADLEYRLTLGTNEALQLQSLIGLFMTSRCLMNKTI